MTGLATGMMQMWSNAGASRSNLRMRIAGDALMNEYFAVQGPLSWLIYGCIGYLLGATVVAAAVISRGLEISGKAKYLIGSLHAIHAVISLGALLVLSMLIGKAFEGRLTTSGSIVMLASFTATVFVAARVFVAFGFFRSEPSR